MFSGKDHDLCLDGWFWVVGDDDGLYVELSLLEEFSTVGGEDDCKGELSLLVVFHNRKEDDGLQDRSVLHRY